MAMLADTDAGSIVTAAQSGARWGYRLLWLQILLIPILYFVQELTVRLGLSTGKGQGSLIHDHFGRGWAWFSVIVIFISAVGALITEFVGISGAGLLFQIPPQYSVGLAVIFLLGIVLTGSYRRVELIGIAVGFFEVSW
jgi:NRAMP (natural resistance-associated macrophage protein)-like metal ion transporter